MSNHDTMKQFIKQISGQANMLTIPRLYIEILDGDILAALFLSQSVYWSDKSKRQDGWFYKSAKEWKDDIGLTAHQVTRVSDLLVENKFLETQLKKANGAPTTHYRVHLENLMYSVLRFFENQKSENPIFEKPEIGFYENGKSLTETTQENTTDEIIPSLSFGVCACCKQEFELKTLFTKSHAGVSFLSCSICDLRGQLPADVPRPEEARKSRIGAAMQNGTSAQMDMLTRVRTALRLNLEKTTKNNLDFLDFLRTKDREGMPVEKFAHYWTTKHWAGIKGQVPTLNQIVENWYAAFDKEAAVVEVAHDGSFYV